VSVARRCHSASRSHLFRGLAIGSVALLMLVGSYVLAGTGQRAEEGSGFQTNHLFLEGPGGDSISPFSGDAETVINIGPTLQAGGGLSLGLTLHHSTKIWTRWDSNATRALKRKGPFGVGWRLHLGRVYLSQRNGQFEWIYESSDGAQHPIMFNTSTGGDMVDPAQRLYFHGTTDSTYIRVEPLAGTTPIAVNLGPAYSAQPTPSLSDLTSWRLYMGNGEVHTFGWKFETVDSSHGADDDFQGWYLSSIEKWDSAGHAVGRIQVTYAGESDAALAHCIARIEFLAPDSTGVLVVRRTITFENSSTVNGVTVEGGYTMGITFPAVQGQNPASATYSFHYSGPKSLTFNPPGITWSTTFSDQFLLSAIRYPFPTAAHRDAYPMSFQYDEDPNDDDGVSGDLKRRTLPTGAIIEYVYSTYVYTVPGTSQSVWLREVATKNIYLDGPNDTIPEGTWTYYRFRGGGSHAQYAVVTDPFNNDTVYRFSQFGFVTKTETYKGPCTDYYWGTGDRVRTSGMTYTGDASSSVPQHEWTIYHDYQNKLLERKRLGFQHFGHFTTVREYDFQQVPDFPDPNNMILPDSIVPYRQTISSYDELDPNNTSKPNDQERWSLWFIHKLDSTLSADGAGTPVRKVSQTYRNDGRVLTSRLYLDPASSGGNEDLIAESVYDPLTNNLERSFTRKAAASTPAFGSRFEYLNNELLVKTRVLDPNQPAASSSQAFWYPSTNLVRDQNSGVTVKRIDPAGFEQNSEYDTLGRITKTYPANDPNEKGTIVSYPSIFETVVEQGDEPTDPNGYTRRSYKYDGLGRMVEERRKTESGCEALRRTGYDIMGRVTWTSEWGFDAGCPSTQLATGTQLALAAKKTEFYYYSGGGTYDPLGRIQKVKSPDGKETTATYGGLTKTVTSDPNGPAPSITRYEKDAFGRVVFVDSPVGADLRNTYDVLDRLTRVELIDSSSTPPKIQVRMTSYDGLGRVRSSTNPENGTVFITSYDAGGRVIEKIDTDGRKYSFTYDAAGRLLTSSSAEDTTSPGAGPTDPRTYGAAELIVQNFYDEPASENGTGRLTRVDSFEVRGERIALEAGVMLSRRKLSYGGRNGRLSADSITFGLWDGREGLTSGDCELRTTYSYNNLGLLSEMTYPAPVDSNCLQGLSSATVAKLNHSYRYGALDKIEDANRLVGSQNTKIVDGVVYNAAGGLRLMTHGNGLATNVVPDEASRVESIGVLYNPSGPTDPNDSGFSTNAGLFWTGLYSYDGRGNIVSIGPGTDGTADQFGYDLISRLVSASVHYKDSAGNALTYLESYQYDGFGNMIRRDWTPPNGSATYEDFHMRADLSNRLDAFGGSAASYDQRGNLLGNSDMQHSFDPLNRMVAARNNGPRFPVARYAYDSGGERIEVVSGRNEYRTFYVRDLNGNVLSEFGLPPSKRAEAYQKDYFYALGRLIGMATEKSPAPPEDFLAGGDTSDPEFTTFTLQWAASGSLKYRVFRKIGVNGTWGQVGADLNAGTSNFSEGTSGGLSHRFYKVAAVDPTTSLESIPTRTVRYAVGSAVPPSAPTGVRAQRRDRSVTLRWTRSAEDTGFGTGSDRDDPVSYFQGYRVYKLNGSNWVELTLFPVTEPVFEDLDVVPGTTYYYQVRGVDTFSRESAGNATVSGTPGDSEPPNPPQSVAAFSGPEAGQITLRWDRSVETDVTGYQLYYKSSGYYQPTGSFISGSDATQVVVAGLTDGSHTFALAAKDAVSFSALSADATARTRANTPSPTAGVGRWMRWTDNVVRAEVSWTSVAGSPIYRVYRRLDEQPWSGFKLIFSEAGINSYQDYSVDDCKAYSYLVRAADPATGAESVDPNDEAFTQRGLRPTAPTATGNVTAQTITLNWGSFVHGCVPVQDGFRVVKWIIKTSATPGAETTVTGSSCAVANPTGDIKILNPDVTSCAITYTNVPPARPFAVLGEMENIHHSGSSSDPARYFDSMISDDICASLTTYTTLEGDCEDLSDNDPAPPVPGGSGSEGEAYDPGTLIRRGSVEYLDFQEPSQAGERIAEATRTISPILSQPGQSSASEFEGSGYRLIGAPSAKQFMFEYFHLDHLGSPRLITDAAKQPVSRYKYLPYGKELMLYGSSKNTHMFTGHERDAETGNDYMHARTYSAAAKRFHQTDPLPGVNLYSYAGNAPTIYIDPTGKSFLGFRGGPPQPAGPVQRHINDGCLGCSQSKANGGVTDFYNQKTGEYLGSAGSGVSGATEFTWGGAPLGSISVDFGVANLTASEQDSILGESERKFGGMLEFERAGSTSGLPIVGTVTYTNSTFGPAGRQWGGFHESGTTRILMSGTLLNRELNSRLLGPDYKMPRGFLSGASNILAHEVGHLFGLKDQSVLRSDIMFGTARYFDRPKFFSVGQMQTMAWFWSAMQGIRW
jgi:RHS repeat-associated protein